MGFVAEFETTGWFEADESTVAVTCADGDVLVASAVCGNQLRTLSIDDTAGGGGLTWAAKGAVSKTSRCSIAQWTAGVGPGQGGTFDVTVLFPSAGAGGLNVSRWEDVAVGAFAVGDATDPAAPSLNIDTTEDDSAIVVVVGDHETVDGTTRTWRTGAGALTELTYFRSNSENAVYLGYHADAGAAGTKTVGLTLPNDMRPSIAAVELTPAAAAPEITGDAAFTSPAAELAATGTATVAGTGALTSPAAVVAGSGTVAVAGTAALASAAGQLASAGAVLVDGAAELVSPPAVVAATGLTAISGTAAFTAPAAILAGSNAQQHDVVLTASLGEQDSPTASLGPRRWTATLGSQP